MRKSSSYVISHRRWPGAPDQSWPQKAVLTIPYSEDMGVTSVAEYKASLTAEAISTFRSQCGRTAAILAAAGVLPQDLVVESKTVTIPRSFLGIKRSPEIHQESVVTLRGWELQTVTTLMGTSGREWYRYTTTAALDTAGRLRRIARQEESWSGPNYATSKESVQVFEMEDHYLPLFDTMEPENFTKCNPPGYWLPFPGQLGEALSRLAALATHKPLASS